MKWRCEMELKRNVKETCEEMRSSAVFPVTCKTGRKETQRGVPKVLCSALRRGGKKMKVQRGSIHSATCVESRGSWEEQVETRCLGVHVKRTKSLLVREQSLDFCGVLSWSFTTRQHGTREHPKIVGFSRNGALYLAIPRLFWGDFLGLYFQSVLLDGLEMAAHHHHRHGWI